MVSLLKQLFGLDEAVAPAAAPSAAETATVRKIVEALDRMEPERARYVASFAYILGRVAHADLDISVEETRAMERVMVERGGLPEDQAILVVQIAKSQNLLFGGTENFLVTREFNEIADRSQKLQLLDCLYTVSASDENISTVEDNEISKIANELGLPREALVRAREAHAEYLAVLRRPDASADGPESVD